MATSVFDRDRIFRYKLQLTYPRPAEVIESHTHRSSIEELRTKLAKWLVIPGEDADMIDFCLAVYKSHEIPGDPLWGIIVDASGGGKTEMLRALRNRPTSYFLSKLTDKSLVSGYRDPKSPDKDPSLLPGLNGKVLIIKDLSPLLSMRRESRNQILGDLRDAYDGFTDQGWGNIGRVGYESRFTFLCATTLAVDRYDSVEQELGERCIKFRARSKETASKVRRAIQNTGSDDIMRLEIETAINSFLNSLPPLQPAQLTEEEAERLATLADFTAIARSHVARDRQHNVKYLPRPEVGTRLGKELAKLYVALAHVRGKAKPDGEDLRTVARVAEDSLPPNRLGVLRVLRASEPLRIVQIAEGTALPWSTVKQTVEDLVVLGIFAPVSGPDEADTHWQLTLEWKKALEDLPLLAV